ncbi:MAG: GIY-YIG nuclease family protein [Bacteroidales bacterium]|nr:GIY-YIG nuclease family protein [Bacteroidales bacterium]MCF8301990.1 GIY-YIG nuclease family protein [Bacteroidales bacterium]
MYWVYAIQSEIDGRIYVGISQNVDLRVNQHNKGHTRSTKGYRPWGLVYTEQVGESMMAARKREKYYKSGIGREKIKQLSKAP